MARPRATVVLLASLAAAVALAQTAPAPPQVQEELICERSPKDHWGPPWTEPGVASADLRKVVWLSRRGGPWQLVVNGEAVGPLADEHAWWTVSPDGAHVLRAGRQAKSWFVWLDGQQVAGPFDEVQGLQFAPDGRALFAARRAKAWTWFLDGREQSPATTEVGIVRVSGQRVAFGALMSDGWHMVVDGQPGPSFEGFARAAFSPDGSRFAYVGLRKGQAIAVVDGKEGSPHAGVAALRFTPDSRRVAYAAIETPKDGLVGRLVADGQAGRAYPAFLQNAADELFAWSYWQNRERELRPYLTGTSAPVFRSDGKLLIAARTTAPATRMKVDGPLDMVRGLASATGQEGIWLEGEEKPLFPASFVVLGPVLSQAGERVGWVEWDAKADKWIGLVDGNVVSTTPGAAGRSNFTFHVTLSPDGSRLGFVHVSAGSGFTRGTATHALRRAVATGAQEEAYDAEDLSNLRFSEDGKHFAYEVHGAKGYETPGRKYGSFVVVDGRRGRAYTDVLGDSMRFVGPGSVAYVARVQETKDGPYRYYRVTQVAADATP